jgi:hypothetical protein
MIDDGHKSEASVLNFEVETLDFGMDPEALQLADPFSASRTTGSGEIAADGAVLS